MHLQSDQSPPRTLHFLFIDLSDNMSAPQPFKEQPHVTALVRNREFVHAHLGRNIDYLLDRLERASVLTESNIKRIKRIKPEKVERLLSFVKYYGFDRFIDFLEVLRDCYSETADKDFWYCLKRLIDEVKDAPASELNLSPDCEKRLNDLKWFVTSEEFYFPVETALINKSNMMFYSSVHGVSITFQSLPVKEFEVSLTVLDPSLFKYSEDFELCTMMVDITTKPQILKFAADSILVSIPHCAVVSRLSDAECLSVRALPGPFQLTKKAPIDFSMGEEIKADFGDGCCAHFNISHFTLFAGVKRRRYSGPPLNTREVRNPAAKRPNKRTNDFAFYHAAQDHLIWQFNQVSLTAQQNDSGVYRQVRCCYPLRRSDNFQFVILCYMTLPSLEKSVVMEAARICKCSERELISQSFPISETCSSLLYTVDSSGLSDWNILPMDKFLQIVSGLEKETFCCSRDKSSGILNTVVDVKQMPSAEESTDCAVKFNIMSDWRGSTRNQDSTVVCLQLHNDVFSSVSELHSFLTRYLYTPQLSSIYLLDVTSCNEHYQFLAYLSYHMGTKWRMIGQCLKIDKANLDTIDANHSTNESSEKAFQMLLTWATSHNTAPSLKLLLDALKTCNYSIHINCSIDDSLASAEKQVGHLQVPVSLLYDICHNSTITKWLFIGRFLGLENHQLERVLSDNTGVVERSYQMFLLWISSFGSSATYKCLARAFFLVHQLDSTCVNAAWMKIKRHIGMLSSTGQQIHVN